MLTGHIYLIALMISSISLATYLSMASPLKFMKLWSSYKPLGPLGKVIWLTIYVFPYLGGYLILMSDFFGRISVDISANCLDDCVKLAVGYIFISSLCVVPLFLIGCLFSGTSESYTIRTFDVPSIIGKKTKVASCTTICRCQLDSPARSFAGLSFSP